jgi:hypothetical protein
LLTLNLDVPIQSKPLDHTFHFLKLFSRSSAARGLSMLWGAVFMDAQIMKIHTILAILQHVEKKRNAMPHKPQMGAFKTRPAKNMQAS